MDKNKHLIAPGLDPQLIDENEMPKTGGAYAQRLSEAFQVPVGYYNQDGVYDIYEEGNHTAVPNGDSYFAPIPMKGVQRDLSNVERQGKTRSHWTSMFSVGDLVAFESIGFISPDGKKSTSGVNLLQAKYSLQDEIDLTQQSANKNARYKGGVSFDSQDIITLKPVFLHIERRNGVSCYLTGIFSDNNPRLNNESCLGVRIEEIRNNSGLYLHVYQIGSDDARIAAKENNIEDAIIKIEVAKAKTEQEMNELQSLAQDEREKHGLGFTNAGILFAKLNAKRAYGHDKQGSESSKLSRLAGFDLLIRHVDLLNTGKAIAMVYNPSFYYIPSNRQITSESDIGVPLLGSRSIEGEEEISVYVIAKKKMTKGGRKYCGSFMAGGVVDVFQGEDGKFSYRTNRNENLDDNKDWMPQVSYDIARYEIETGDEGDMKVYNDEYNKIKENNKKEFDDLYQTVVSFYGKDIIPFVKKHKGKIRAILRNLANDELSNKLADKKDLLSKALLVSVDSSIDTVLTLISLIAYNPNSIQIKKVFGTSFASDTSWAHYTNILGLALPTHGTMPSVSAAYNIYYREFKDQYFHAESRDYAKKGFSNREDYLGYLADTAESGVYVSSKK